MLVVETDVPFIPIKPTKELLLSNTSYIIKEISRLKQMDVIECGKQIYSNSIQFICEQNI